MVQAATRIDQTLTYESDTLASQLAEELRSSQLRRDSSPVPARLKKLKQFFQTAYNHFEEAGKTHVAVSNASEWLLDNFYVIKQAIQVVEDDLPADYYARLPKIPGGPTRAYLIALAINRDTPRLDVEQIKSFVQSFQRTTPLQVGEIWALPLMLRLVVMETLANGLADITRLKWEAALEPDLWTKIKSTALQGAVPDFPEADSETKVVHSILNLRLLATLDWKEFFESTSVLEQTLQRDPANVYRYSDFDTRNSYRSMIEELARGSTRDENEIATLLIDLAATGATARERHIGYYLIAEGRARLEQAIRFQPSARGRFLCFVRSHASFVYLGSISFLMFFILAAVLLYAISASMTLSQLAVAALLASLPASAMAIDFINWLVVLIIPPRRLPKMNFETGVPVEYRTMVVVPSLLATERDIPFLIHQIENHFVANSDPNLFFALLTDFADAPEKTMPRDDELVAQAQAEIEQLNERYGNGEYRPFYLFHRERLWNPGEDCWMGWERKRGKLEEFNQLLRGSTSTSYQIQIGDLSVLESIRYVITLDADTLLPRESARRLIGTLAHVLNRAEFESDSAEIKAGYTILQPRVQVRPAVINQSTFARAYTGDSIIDLYSRAVSDVYQDLFGEGNFVGKGIYDVEAFERSLHDKIPENSLLSHDLFEALQGSCGLVTDVVLFEDYPPHYVAYTDRLHRWVRGDWQLLPWLNRWVPRRTGGKAYNALSLIDRWRILDNLRRSLLAPAVLALLIGAWLFLPGPGAVLWMLFALAPYLLPILLNLISELLRTARDDTATVVTRPIRLAALRSLFEILFLPHETLIILDAILSAVRRLYFTHRHMLEWMTAAHTVQLFGKRLQVKSAWQAMRIAPVIALALGIGIYFKDLSVLFFSAPLLFGWLISPYLAARISKPDVQPENKLTPLQEEKLRQLARSTWLYFEHFVSPEDRWLPPDHFQESPRGSVQHQTSPTNIGLMLLSTLAAHDIGYIGASELSLRLRDTFDSLDSLERLRGHFLNWYDTRTFTPLLPRYISTVDSGNLAACLLVLRQGCLGIGGRPVVQWQGVVDTIHVFLHTLEQSNLGKSAAELKEMLVTLCNLAETLGDPSHFSPAHLVKFLEDGQAEFETILWDVIQNSGEELSADTLRALATWVQRVRYQLRHLRTDLQVLTPWLMALADVQKLIDKPVMEVELASAWNDLLTALPLHPTLGEIPQICDRAIPILERIMGSLEPDDSDSFNWCEVLAFDLQVARKLSASLLEDFASLAERAESFFQEMNFNFLYDPNRHVFHIGYNVEAGRMDPNYYDLIASESRLSSLIAIARGDVPQNHWLYLARPITELGGKRVLLSWSGTMFEYLMPNLCVESYPNTLMEQSCRVAVEQQMAYASEKNIPWGISESSYYNFDSGLIYQYQAFGVPQLGYKRGLADNLVVTPYASLLALSLTPQEVLQNLSWFEKHKMWALYGLYESVDFTPERLKIGEQYAVVRSYMAHHQGMIFLSLHNYLFNKLMVRRLHSDPRIKSIELLLQEQMPVNVPTEHPRPQPMETARGAYVTISLDPWRVSPEAPYPQIHTLSNGRYSLLISASGSGFSRWHDLELTRWRADSTLDDWGQWIYVEDRINGKLWSITPQPTMTSADRSEVSFLPHRVEFERQDGDILLRTSIGIAPEDDVEIRRITITNHGNEPHLLALTSYMEIILSQQAVDQRHPAFNKLFIESEFLAEEGCLLFHRRPRSANEKPVYLAHFFTSNYEKVELSGYETDRKLFLGRGGTAKYPGVFSIRNEASILSGKIGATLDPVCALQAEVALSAYATAQIAFITLTASSRKEAIQLVYRYRRWSQVSRALADARRHIEKEITQLNITSQKIEQFQKLLSPLLYASPALRADPAVLASNTLGQPGLWAFAISGDYPILLLRLNRDEDLSLLGEVLQAYTYWRRRGLMIDLVILNQRASGYDEGLHGKIHRTLVRTGTIERLNKRGGIFILREDQMSEPERILLQAAARVILDGEAGPLKGQLARLDVSPVRLPRFVPIEETFSESMPPVQRPDDLLFDNELGGFTPDGREYVIHLAPGQWTPAPWINVIATPEFGCIVSESGLGCTWAGNSGENRLTPWRNDAVSDPPAEAMYLRDEDTGEIWSPTPSPARAAASYLIRHGAGYSTFQHASHGLEQNMRVFVAANEPVKIVQLKLKNTSKRIRRINAVYFAEWVLGTTHENTAPHIIPEFAGGQFALLARNPYNQDFCERVAFLASTREPTGMTADRVEFLGRHGSYGRPAALERMGLTPRVDAGVEPCAALQVLLWLQPGETKEVTFLLGQGKDRADAERILSHFQHIENVQTAWDQLGAFWEEMLGQIQVDTPDQAMNVLLNRWLLYQSLTARFWGRTGFYQSSGAFGYRDQLQDALAYIHTKPELLKEHILNAARYQFEQGDVLHWWHPPAGRGLRTRCSDDLLWLPFVTAHYVEVTGDREILKESIPFLGAEPLKADEHERYGQFPFTSEGTLYEHCCRAIAKGTTAGIHGIPLMGSHDWNDGMNLVGAKGRGESIWLGWFLASTLTNFAHICELMDDQPRAEEYRKQAKKICAAIESAGWDGDWYRRAYYDDGFPLGSKANNDCQIDSIAQSWAILSKGGDPVRAERAMDSVYEHLVNREDALVLLLKPPFDKTPRNPGYIKGYPPGIRENGGQYTHAALWAIWAFADLGDGARAHRLFELINPIHHSDSLHKVSRYRVEPYVIAADVYSTPPHNGRGGWTWYTGSASWMYRLGVERLLGITRLGNYLEIHPCIPGHWKGYQINYRFGNTLYHIRVENPQGERNEVSQIQIDGKHTSELKIPLEDDGKTHEVIVTMK
ncbi:MAG TPA: glucoamylase family protein [Anaerolineales bacterium]|nr:glucoamylase family protein [Anaerolineales bacterium]